MFTEKTYMQIFVLASYIIDKKWETMQISFNGQMYKQTVAYPHNEIPFKLKGTNFF